MREYIVANPNGRPNMISMERVEHCLIEGVDFKNSPRYHIELNDVNDFVL